MKYNKRHRLTFRYDDADRKKIREIIKRWKARSPSEILRVLIDREFHKEQSQQ